jgi:hypothetical protein
MPIPQSEIDNMNSDGNGPFSTKSRLLIFRTGLIILSRGKVYLLCLFYFYPFSKVSCMKTNNWVLLLFVLAFFSSCQNKKTLFRQVSPKDSGIDFANNIVENDSVNPIDITNVYNGGGVGAGDFNNDGLQDLYFTGNTVPINFISIRVI